MKKTDRSPPPPPLGLWLKSPIPVVVFIQGKGGVGKSKIAKALAEALATHPAASAGTHKIAWVTLTDNQYPIGAHEVNEHLTHLNLDPDEALKEYAGILLKIPGVARFFAGNRLIRYMAEVTPGLYGLLLIGKIWHERENFQVQIIDMPSTGYGITMFQAVHNFKRLFRMGPLARDAGLMIETFANPAGTHQIIVSLPEELPLSETIELKDLLQKMFPEVEPRIWINRRAPRPLADTKPLTELELQALPMLTTDAAEYSLARYSQESLNLEEFTRTQTIDFEIPWVPKSEKLSRFIGGLHP